MSMTCGVATQVGYLSDLPRLGADTSAVDARGRTPLAVAAESEAAAGPPQRVGREVSVPL